MRPQTRSIEDSRWVKFLYEVHGRADDFHNRSITITPYCSYGKVAGYVLTVDGTPPTTTALIPSTWTSPILLASPTKMLEPGTASFDRMLGFMQRYGFLD